MDGGWSVSQDCVVWRGSETLRASDSFQPMNAKHVFLALASLAAVVAAYGPMLRDFGFGLWAKPHYQHFPFVLLAAVLLTLGRLREDAAESWLPPRWLSYVGYVMAWGLLALAYWVVSPLLAAVSLILLLGGWLLSLSHSIGCSFPLGPWMLLWLVVPPPLGLDGALMQRLQRSSSLLSSYVLDLAGINHLMDGNALVLPDKQLFVDEACSGIISVISLLACGALYGVWRRRGGLHTVLLMALAAGWATLLNVVRISSIAMAWTWWGIDWSEGLPHTVLGLVVFALSLLTLAATDWLLKATLAEIGPRWDLLSGESLQYGSRLVAWWDALIAVDPQDTQESGYGTPGWSQLGLSAAALSLGIAPTVAFAGLGAAQLMAPSTGPVIVGARIDLERFSDALQQDLMPEELFDLKLRRVAFENRSATSRFGEYSVLYEYENPRGKLYVVSCDYPFSGGWHELSVCYSGIGWRIDERQVIRAEVEDAFDYARLEMTKPDGRNALVSFAACYADGEEIEPPTYGLLERLTDSLQRGQKGKYWQHSFQVQVLTESATGVTPEDIEVSAKLLQQARKRLIAAATKTMRTN